MSTARVPHLVKDCKFTHNGREFLQVVEQYCERELGLGIVDPFFSDWSSLCSLIYQLQAKHTSNHRPYFFNIRYTTSTLGPQFNYDSYVGVLLEQKTRQAPIK